MSVDNIEWEQADKIFNKILSTNREGLFFATLPYKVGIITTVSAAMFSIPLLFHLDSVLWFNENYVTTGK